jgi:arabinoxylan arabinofuranohydrolase
MIVAEKNPILPRRGVCDPHVHVFNGRAYLYASHDSSAQNDGYVMHDWEVWSSGDLVRWRREAVVRPEECYMGPSSSCWATDAAERNGKYYFYVSNGTEDTGAFVSDNPGGPFRPCCAGPVLPAGLTPTKQYDPAVFIDDDERRSAYILFGTPAWAGGDSYYIARLDEDMVSLAERPKKLIVDDGADDKAFLHKHTGLYYLSWASYYAISGSVYGPYKLAGNIGASSDHSSFFKWNNQCFNAFTIYDPSVYFRATGLCYVHYRRNGLMAADQMIVEYGVGQYRAEWNKIEAEWYMAAGGLDKLENCRSGFELGNMTDGSYAFFPNIRGLAENTGMCFFAASKAGRCEIEIRSDAPDGPLLGRCAMEATGTYDWMGYRTHLCTLRNPKGTASIYLIFRGEGWDFLRLDWFRFCGDGKA